MVTCVPPALSSSPNRRLEIDGDLARVGIERLFFLAAFLEQAMAFGGGEGGIVACGFQSEVGEDLVEVVAAEVGNAVGGFDGVLGFAHGDERDVEGAAAHVVDEQAAANAAAALRAVAVGKLDGGS